MRLAIFVFLLFLCSCSAQWHLNQAQRKDPGIFSSDTSSTITFTTRTRIDTFYLDTIKVDTLLEVDTRLVVDTVEVIKDGVATTIYINRADTVERWRVQTRIDSIPVPVEITDTVWMKQDEITDTYIKMSWWRKWWWILIVLGAGAALLLRRLLNKN